MARIFVFSDVHGGAMPEYPEDRLDAWAFAGDLYEDGLSGQYPGAARYVRDWLLSRTKPVFSVRGNHDTRDPARFFATSRDLSHGRVERLGDGIAIAGIGWAGQRCHDLPEDTQFYGHWEELEKGLQAAGGPKAIVLLTHYPPLVAGLFDAPGKAYPSIRRIIDDLMPLAVVQGHVHEWFGRTGRLGRTLVASPGPRGGVLSVDAGKKTAEFNPA